MGTFLIGYFYSTAIYFQPIGWIPMITHAFAPKPLWITVPRTELPFKIVILRHLAKDTVRDFEFDLFQVDLAFPDEVNQWANRFPSWVLLCDRSA